MNFGQGSPETGSIPGAPPRLQSIPLTEENIAYSPVGGTTELRACIAHLYNSLYREGKRSRYSAENVCIAGGGRVALARILSSLAPVRLGYFLPEYTSYKQLLASFRTFEPVPILLSEEAKYHIDLEGLQQEIEEHDLKVLLTSNPSNPTGRHIRGRELQGWVDLARTLACTVIFDEFYSHYVYGDFEGESHGMVSAASSIEDVEEDPVLLVDGVTKNWRYPGLRLSWVLGPSEAIASITRAGSFLDGGPSHPLQEAVLPFLDPKIVMAKTNIERPYFEEKCRVLCEGLCALGIHPSPPPEGGIYCWADVSKLPPPLHTGRGFFEEALKGHVIVIPGEHFDITPDGCHLPPLFQDKIRLCFGPNCATLKRGLTALTRVIS